MRRLGLSGLALLLLLGVMTGPVTAQGAQKQKKVRQSALAPVATSPDSKAMSAADESTYVIGPQDVLDINVWKEPEV